MALRRTRQQHYNSRRAKIKHAKRVWRALMLKRRWRPYPFRSHRKRNSTIVKRDRRTYYTPALSANIRHIVANKKTLNLSKFLINRHPGVLEVPEIFSLVDEPKVSYDFILGLFGILHGDAAQRIMLDYSKCKRIDLDAQVLMDVLLKDFIFHF